MLNFLYKITLVRIKASIFSMNCAKIFVITSLIELCEASKLKSSFSRFVEKLENVIATFC